MISACVNCRDDEATIARWIACVVDYVSEIIICDTGSQDNTKKVIQDHQLGKLKLFEHPWPGFLKARNWFFDLASKPFILQFDVDEVVLGSFWHKTPHFIKSLEERFHSIRLPHYCAEFNFSDFDTLERKAQHFDLNFKNFSYPRDVLYRRNLKNQNILWQSFHQQSEVFSNLSSDRYLLNSEPLIHSYPANHKIFNAEYHARKIFTYAKLIPGYWETSWSEFLQSRFSSDKINEIKEDIFTNDDPAPHSTWWGKVGRFQGNRNPA